MSRAFGSVLWMVCFAAAGCVQVPALLDGSGDAGNLDLAALEHRVDGAVAPWSPVLPSCGTGASGAGGRGSMTGSGGFGGDDLDAGNDFGPGGFGGGSMGGGPGGPSLPGPSFPGAVVITEIMTDPSALTDTQGEWFELFNPGAEALDLAGCLIADGGTNPKAVGSAFVLEPGQYRSIARAATPGFAPDLVASFSLSNEADTLSLLCAGLVIDAVAYAATQGFPLKAGASLSLDPLQLDAVANDLGSAWCAGVEAYAIDRGTPGGPNPSCVVAG